MPNALLGRPPVPRRLSHEKPPAKKIPSQTLAAAPARSCELKFRETAVFVFFCMINRLAHDL